VVDHESGDKDQYPSERESGLQHGTADFLLGVTDEATEWPPLPEQKEERQAAHKHVRAPLGGGRNAPGNEPLESMSRHQAVLHREERKQPRLIVSAVSHGSVNAESSDFGTTTFPRKPIA